MADEHSDAVGLKAAMTSEKGTRPPSRRGVLLFGAATALSGVTGCSGRAVGAPPKRSAVEPQQIHVDFESGSLGRPITHHVGAAVSPAFAETGKNGCRLEPLPAKGDLAALVFEQSGFAADKPWATVSISFRLVTLPKSSDTYMNLFEIGNTATRFPKSQFTVYFKHDRLVCDFNTSETMNLSAMPIVGAWHRIDAVVGYGAKMYTADVRFDGGATKKLTSKDNKSVEKVKSLWIHYPTVPVDYTMDIDDIRMMTTSARPQFLPVA